MSRICGCRFGELYRLQCNSFEDCIFRIFESHVDFAKLISVVKVVTLDSSRVVVKMYGIGPMIMIDEMNGILMIDRGMGLEFVFKQDDEVYEYIHEIMRL